MLILVLMLEVLLVNEIKTILTQRGALSKRGLALFDERIFCIFAPDGPIFTISCACLTILQSGQLPFSDRGQEINQNTCFDKLKLFEHEPQKRTLSPLLFFIAKYFHTLLPKK